MTSSFDIRFQEVKAAEFEANDKTVIIKKIS